LPSVCSNCPEGAKKRRIFWFRDC